MPPKPDLVYPSLDDFVDEYVSESVVEKPTIDSNDLKENGAPIIEDWVSKSEEEDEPKELKFNLFSVSQMCYKKNSVLFVDTACVVLSLDFKLTDESHVLLKVPRKDNMYNVDLKDVVPQGSLTCLFTKATSDESTLWHRRLGHGFAAVLAVLVTGTSQSRQHGKSELNHKDNA
uniref:Ribonuclease H-like domain-containing protein n=1 Tax=Tanacetum cinerariifolium TaxID=118510 RepID=A0A6L2L378_TANCI|nr:ribonuclease H-like domain-containing protein [Tanacetum cinerariifolium]